MDKEFVISYLKTRNYWWQTREVSPADKGIYRQESYYWKNKYEVDFIYDDSVFVLPVEVKYREHPVAADTRGLIECMHVFNLNLGIIVTKDMLKKEIIAGKEIIFIPVWLFLLFL